MILVTGATGNVGRQILSQLLNAGATVRALGTPTLPESRPASTSYAVTWPHPKPWMPP